MKAIQVTVPGGPESLQLVDVPVPKPGAGQALVRLAASGVNFIDIYFRTGLYKADVPIAIGSEGAGTVEAVGEGVTEVAPGRPCGLCDGARIVRRVRGGAGGATGENTRTRGFPNGGGRHAAGHDGALSDALHVSAQSRTTRAWCMRRRAAPAD